MHVSAVIDSPGANMWCNEIGLQWVLIWWSLASTKTISPLNANSSNGHRPQTLQKCHLQDASFCETSNKNNINRRYITVLVEWPAWRLNASMIISFAEEHSWPAFESRHKEESQWNLFAYAQANNSVPRLILVHYVIILEATNPW